MNEEIRTKLKADRLSLKDLKAQRKVLSDENKGLVTDLKTVANKKDVTTKIKENVAKRKELSIAMKALVVSIREGRDTLRNSKATKKAEKTETAAPVAPQTPNDQSPS
jgi:hypothetical protein